LKTNNILIHFFNETFSNEEIENLLESNNLKINKNLDIQPELTILDLISKNKDLDFKTKQDLIQDYIEAFKNSKNKKWFKKIKSKAVVIAMFLALFTKTRDKKFKLLLQETIDNLNNDYQLNINRDYPDEAFIKVFYEYIINASVKKSLIIVLISLVVIFIAILTMILVIT
ncbi:MAG: hypothetical protein K2K73_01820, partial [Ureaplasma sp.]|nr:hypothetical protein [Ureaplasma sp.]